MMEIKGHPLIDGEVVAPLVKLEMPLSLWGGLDVETGAIMDATHPQRGVCLAGAMVAMSAARGSSSSSSTLVEAVRLARAPAAFILTQADPILTIGSLVAADLYGIEVPIMVIDPESLIGMPAHEMARVRRGGMICISAAGDAALPAC